VTPTLNPTTSVEASITPIAGASSSPTPHLKGEILTDHETAAEATGTAVAGLEAAVAATATALAVTGQDSITGMNPHSELFNWLQQWGDVVMLGGGAAGATLLMVGLFIEGMRRKSLMKSRKSIHSATE
jgi:hypothetical protein